LLLLHLLQSWLELVKLELVQPLIIVLKRINEYVFAKAKKIRTRNLLLAIVSQLLNMIF
jgi:hypothetical protein